MQHTTVFTMFCIISLIENVMYWQFHLIQTVSASIVVGSQVWVEDSEVAWIDGEAVEVNDEEVKVICSSGKTVSISYLGFY